MIRKLGGLFTEGIKGSLQQMMEAILWFVSFVFLQIMIQGWSETGTIPLRLEMRKLQTLLRKIK